MAIDPETQTQIAVYKTTREALREYKLPRDSYDDVIRRLIDWVKGIINKEGGK